MIRMVDEDRSRIWTMKIVDEDSGWSMGIEYEDGE